MKLICCDICKTPLHPANWHSDFEICVKCDLQVAAASAIAANAARRSQRLDQELQAITDLYLSDADQRG